MMEKDQVDTIYVGKMQSAGEARRPGQQLWQDYKMIHILPKREAGRLPDLISEACAHNKMRSMDSLIIRQEGEEILKVYTSM